MSTNPRGLLGPSLLAAALCACGSETATPSPTPDAAVDAPADQAPAADAPVADAPVADAQPDVTSTPDAAVADAAEPPVEADPCDALHAGTVSNYTVDGTARSFILTLPQGATATGGHWPVVFNWHGLGDTARNFNGLLAGQVDNATMPFILVTPESTHLGPTTTPLGLEWDEIMVSPPNREARLFDAVVRCLDARWGVDRDRVYTVGFSAGAIMSDLLAVLRGDQLAAVVSYSGGYFADPENPPTLGPLRGAVSWPELTTRNRYTQLMLFGGATDTFNLVVATAHFDQFARNDATFLRAMGHDVIVCDHGGGHRVPTAVMGAQLVAFFAAHPRGAGPSPWASALPSGWPDWCAFQGRSATP